MVLTWAHGGVTNFLQVYDPSCDEWSWAARCFQEPCQAVFVHNSLHVISHRSDLSGGTLRQLNPWTGVSQTGIALPFEHLSGVTVLDGAIYVGGTYNTPYIMGCDEFESIFCRLAPASSAWEELSSRDFTHDCDRCDATVPWLGFCGKVYNIAATSDSQRVVRFDATQKKWEYCCSLSVPRWGCAAVASDHHIYACGGGRWRDKNGSCERYCPLSDRWTAMASMQVPRSGVDFCAVFLDNCIYVLGGGEQSVERYNIRLNQWQPAAPLPSLQRNPSDRGPWNVDDYGMQAVCLR